MRLSAFTLGNCSSRLEGSGNGSRDSASRDVQGAAGGTEEQRRQLTRHEDFYRGCGNVDIPEKKSFEGKS